MTAIAMSLMGTGVADAASIVVAPTADASTLASAILGAGITLVGTPTFIGGDGTLDTNGLYSAGTFSTMADANPATGIPFASGIILTSGDVTGAPYNLQYDGFTTLLTASALGLSAGTHTATFRIADTSDEILDAAVFIEAASFAVVPEPSRALMIMAGIAGMASLRRKSIRI